MKYFCFLLAVLVLINFTIAFPYNNNGRRALQQRTLMMNGYYMPQGGMSAVLTDAGDAAFASTGHEMEEESEEEIVNEQIATTIKPKRPFLKRKPVKENEDDEDEGANNWPFARKGSVPSYNAFFPIMISGQGNPGSRTRSANGNDGEYYPSGAGTAIANSFSTGKGGVASSHAVSLADPYLSQMFRSGMFNFGQAKKRTNNNN